MLSGKAFDRNDSAPGDGRPPGVTHSTSNSRLVGSNALKVHDKIFAMFSSGGHFVVELSKARVDALVDGGAGERFDAGQERPMKSVSRAGMPTFTRSFAKSPSGMRTLTYRLYCGEFFVAHDSTRLCVNSLGKPAQSVRTLAALNRRMDDSSPYTPPEVWAWKKENGGRFANINRPIAGAMHEQELPVGRHPLQLYSLGTPNGVKVTVMLEELLALGHACAEYDAWLVRINDGEQFGSGFVAVNPNSKIPALWDRSAPTPIRLFESGAILLHLAEKFEAFLPVGGQERAECLSWLFWQMGSAPFLGGGFGHFYAYAPTKIEYAIDRYAMEVKRQLDVLDRRLADSPYLAGKDYTIADIAVWPWYGTLVKGRLYEAGEFLQVQEYTNVLRWTDEIAKRPAVQRGRMVNRTWGQPSGQLHERHDARDFDTRTQDKLAAST